MAAVHYMDAREAGCSRAELPQLQPARNHPPMTPASNHDLPAGEKHFGFLEIAVLILSFHVLGAHFAQVVFQLPPEVNVLLDRIDFIVCFVFFADFCVRFHRASSKVAFMKWGWIDLISSIPTVDILRWGRLVRNQCAPAGTLTWMMIMM